MTVREDLDRLVDEIGEQTLRVVVGRARDADVERVAADAVDTGTAFLSDALFDQDTDQAYAAAELKRTGQHLAQLGLKVRGRRLALRLKTADRPSTRPQPARAAAPSIFAQVRDPLTFTRPDEVREQEANEQRRLDVLAEQERIAQDAEDERQRARARAVEEEEPPAWSRRRRRLRG